MRRDVYLENDTDLISVVCGCAVDEILQDRGRDNAQFFRRHHALLLRQAAADALIVRVVTDEPLHDDEQAEWITRVRGHLDVADGRVLVMAGFNPDVLAAWEQFGSSDWVISANVEIGLWDVDVYSYAGSPNGNAQLLADGELGARFRRDRPDKRIPLWLARLLIQDGGRDPEFRGEWQDVPTSIGLGMLSIDLEKCGFVGMLVHVHQRTEGDDDTPPDAFFPPETGARTLRTVPAGVLADIEDPGLQQLARTITG
jgi:hypothetical protein